MSCREDGDWQPLEANPWVVSVQGVRLEAYQRVCDYPLEVDSRNLARMGSNLVRRGEQPVYQVRSPQGHRSSRRRNAPTKSRRFADLPGWPLTVPKRPYGKRRESTSCHRGGRALCGNIGSHVDITSGAPGTSSKMGNWEAMPTAGSQVRGHGLRCHPSNIEFGLWIRGAFHDCANPPIRGT